MSAPKKTHLPAPPAPVPEFKDPHQPRLSPHFTEAELGVEAASERVKENARYLCREILERVRDKYGRPVFVTSGYRDPLRNHAAGGKASSYHLYEMDRCAADFKVLGVDAAETFDWLRLESGLPFDKVILEYQDGEPCIIHVQATARTRPRRLAYIGETGAGTDYRPVEVGKPEAAESV